MALAWLLSGGGDDFGSGIERARGGGDVEVVDVVVDDDAGRCVPWYVLSTCIGPEVWSGRRPAYRNLARRSAGVRRSPGAAVLQLSERRS